MKAVVIPSTPTAARSVMLVMRCLLALRT